MSKPLVIVGNGQIAEFYCSLFTRTTDYRVAGFAVDRDLIKTDSLLGLPVVALDEVESRFSPEAVHAFVAIGPVSNNAVRAAKFLEMRQKKYRFASYVSPHAVVSPDVQIGDNVVIGSTSNIGHHCRIHSHAFLPVNAVVAGSVVIGERAFVGTGATIRDNVTIGAGSVIGAGATILGDVEPGSVYVTERAKKRPITADQVRL